MSNPFVSNVRQLATKALIENTFAIPSGYYSKKEKMCKAYNRCPDAVLEALSSFYPTAELLFEQSALEQRIAYSMSQVMAVGSSPICEYRIELKSLVGMIKSGDISEQSLQKHLGHETNSSARIVMKAALRWGFIKEDVSGFIKGDRFLSLGF